MRKALLFITYICLSNSLNAQDQFKNYEIGHYVDINKQLIDGYYDFDYTPQKSLEINYPLRSNYAPGYYYENNGKKVTGLIKMSYSPSKYFTYKKNADDKSDIIKSTECLGYVIGIDTFSIISNSNIQRSLTKMKIPVFVEVIDKVDNLTFYKHEKRTSQSTIITYLVKDNESNFYTIFPKYGKESVSTAISIFGEFEALKNNILKGKYTYDDLPMIIKLFKYYRKYKKEESIYYNSSWDEVSNLAECTYYANTIDLKDSIFHLKFYFNDNTPIFEGNFISFYPHIKTGDFIWYYPNGTKRKYINYINNNPKKLISYYRNGNVKAKWSITDKYGIFYTEVYDKIGKNIFDNFGNGINTIYDSIINREIITEYENHKAKRIYYIDSNGKKIYQKCENNSDIENFAQLKNEISKHVEYPKNSIQKYNHGFILISCIVNSNGFISDMKLIKGLDSECDKLIIDFFGNNDIAKKWEHGTVNGEAVNQEIVVPINFVLEGYSQFRIFYDNNRRNIFLPGI